MAQDRITYHASGNAASFDGPGAVNVFAMAVLASALRLYATTGMQANRAYTPTAMVRAARVHLGPEKSKGIGPREYERWAYALSGKVALEKARIDALSTTPGGGL